MLRNHTVSTVCMGMAVRQRALVGSNTVFTSLAF